MQIQKVSFNNFISRNYYSSKNINAPSETEYNEANIGGGARVSSEFYRANAVPFKSLKLKASERENDFCDTSFYRDFYTLIKAGEILKNTFPDGADIMDFACSNGEEAISIHSLINNRNNRNYKLYCYDKNAKAIELAKKGIHTVYRPGSGDGFILNKYQNSEVYDDVVKSFNKIMEECARPNYDINDPDFIRFIMAHPDFKMKYYKVRDEYKDNFNFEAGNIFKIDKLEPKKAGAVFFRNAMYIPTQNYALDEFDSLLREKSVNKKKVINYIVDKVYDKLLPGGIFVIGENEKDHIYLADKHTSENEKLYIEDYACSIYKKSPLYEALEKDGRFKPVVYSRCYSALGKIEVPTVWQKVR